MLDISKSTQVPLPQLISNQCDNYFVTSIPIFNSVLPIVAKNPSTYCHLCCTHLYLDVFLDNTRLKNVQGYLLFVVSQKLPFNLI
uniref:Uncharacterized protein n=1 Tax=Rhizophora mucronata TaxID=61149 RepID=A0A2P2M4E1_RHIMU